MVLFWFIVGIIVIIGISRYNESDALFWKLFLAFLLGFASCKVYMHITDSNQDKENLTQVYPTQASKMIPGTAQFFLAGNQSEITVAISKTPASKDCAPAQSEVNLIVGKIFGNARDRPDYLFPPIRYMRNLCYFDTS